MPADTLAPPSLLLGEEVAAATTPPSSSITASADCADTPIGGGVQETVSALQQNIDAIAAAVRQLEHTMAMCARLQQNNEALTEAVGQLERTVAASIDRFTRRLDRMEKEEGYRGGSERHGHADDNRMAAKRNRHAR